MSESASFLVRVYQYDRSSGRNRIYGETQRETAGVSNVEQERFAGTVRIEWQGVDVVRPFTVPTAHRERDLRRQRELIDIFPVLASQNDLSFASRVWRENHQIRSTFKQRSAFTLLKELGHGFRSQAQLEVGIRSQRNGSNDGCGGRYQDQNNQQLQQSVSRDSRCDFP